MLRRGVYGVRRHKKKMVRQGRFELPTKGSLRLRTLQSSALPLSYLRTTSFPRNRFPWTSGRPLPDVWTHTRAAFTPR